MLTLSTVVREILQGIYAKLQTVTLVKLCALHIVELKSHFTSLRRLERIFKAMLNRLRKMFNCCYKTLLVAMQFSSVII